MSNNILTPYLPKSKPLVIAHRGASAYAPENTLAAFSKAHELGANWLECDVNISADEVPIIFHDDDLDRICQLKGFLHETKYSDLAKLDVGSWFEQKFAEEKVPTLEQTVKFCSSHDMILNLEVKPFEGLEEKTTHVIIDALEHINTLTTEQLLISSFSETTLRIFHERLTSYPLALNTDKLTDDKIDFAKSIAAVSIHMDVDYNHEKEIARVKSEGFHVGIFTVNDVEKANNLYNHGVDLVFSDCPDLYEKQP